MIDYPIFCRLPQLHDQDRLSIAQIAAELNLHPQTVSQWIGRPSYEQRRAPKSRSSKLDLFKGSISRLLGRSAYPSQRRASSMVRAFSGTRSMKLRRISGSCTQLARTRRRSTASLMAARAAS